MKNLLWSLTFLGTIFITQAQNASVEKSTYGLQIGVLGVWFHNEAKLSNAMALRTELGFDSEIWGGDIYDNPSGFLLTPVITIEPRWYYNLNKRVHKSRRIDGNSGNFLSLNVSYHPDWFVVSNYKNMSVVSDIFIAPTWGIRRNIGNHINYETGIGIGYRYYFAKSAGYLENEGDVDLNIHLRIGYRF
ncbi:hypothetical protein ACG2LH_04005 [Zhouia sp. PK063]|uniref:hypothetical protein n=1 Tax=Zhouia sp. PK063 TaxID=3373602 RepID=UPI0037A0E760